ncbi:DegV family protein [Paenibacillus larvae]|uniref:DegV family protein n=4 Tax=Paenibacillus larvae TaxID=1464 RepID=V9W2Z8_9BACL|nr:DegV family protein [Paenibacillus larvae]AHD05381.1 DegV family protein [Paenibacillus larvae subsp. larvae DSM 25430]AQR77115.1 fatty acid-binding protein DegV [Paenibacillus larvae subsp. larvae]AQT86500.1 fatty acid-binding protein DegV [Paenibacillus larvae subsp. pulvifaciens]AQZ48158.1 fatty acid-binding protein DegV [Paenibacillus larvae subsp. pulvifaciens]ARF66766.1 fatty acid-binding protein DegV [Paenibacillus larvae subsp. pulvifaciens]
MAIKIFADSTSDLPPEIIEKYGIGIIPLYVVFDDQSYKDGVDLTTPELYKLVDRTKKLPKTAAPSPADFEASFKPYIEQGDHIVYISLSSKLSSTMQNAVIAAGLFPEGRVTVVDSLNLSTGIGLLVLKAARLAEAGLSAHDIEQQIRELVPKVETEFVIDTLDYLYMGGRCSGMQNFIGSLLKIRPVIKVVDGGMIMAYKVRGKREKALDQMLQNALKEVPNMDTEIIGVTHSMSEEDAKMLKEKLAEKTNAKEILLSKAGCVISSHCGPNTVGILYIKK